ncbi:MAG: dicarboxylate/amino acid:cation symporter [Gemmatimonas sp.]|uniref:dicarboxylate/amino acid:cation symporter n=1 Tax=Gemmatimonas sp. UBA7669 TaxID=1946568 RepID=UPI0025C1A0D9|nr:cation:dicarboxylase symporter family transporter [Gemmatimonas sp. UBA7669]MBA3918866.1 dicarboxylate/amino acid:cation symporter [Gemmatimonas sp.]
MAHLSSATNTTAPAKKGFLGIGFTGWIVISMIVGILIGWLAPDFAPNLKPFANIFLRMIKSLIVPLLFSTLVVGIAGHGDDMKKVGKLALRSIIYFEVVTTLALAIGLIAVNVAKPGVGLQIAPDASSEEFQALAGKTPTFASVLEHTVPQSFFEAAAQNEVLQIVFFAIIFAVALARVEGPSKTVMLDWLQSLSDIMFKFVGIVMAYAPIGIGAAIGVTVGKSGLDVMINLAKLVGTLYVSLIIFVLIVLVPTALIFRINLKRFWALVKEPWLIAFSTASSEAAFPQAMQAMEKFGVPRRIVSFVLPTGYSFNLDGSTLYLAIASVFVAQAAGIDMPLSQQLLMMLTLMLTSKGVAAVPRASLVILSGALAQFGLPLEGIAVILGVDAVMDMARTSVNLLGNCLATAVMGRWEGELKEPEPETAAA